MKEEKEMSYDFGKKKIGAGEKQERNGGMYSKTLLGQSIVENVVPSWTADGEICGFSGSGYGKCFRTE